MPLLERESHIEELSAVLGRIPCVGGRVVLISGEAGIGKTSLLRQFAAAQNKAVRVLWGGCEALFTPHPLAPLQDISRQIGGDFPKTIGASAGRHRSSMRRSTSLRACRCRPSWSSRTSTGRMQRRST
jgi:predicted ATPase